ncbi:MAG TPA: alpha/beta fold hydrolase [Solirubrobacterales bacterium]|nr:alpha/beta fold hydrolase [Solirubrobacterales bacterium]
MSVAGADVARTPDERFADLADFPHESRYVEWEGLRIAYVDAGEGPPLVMLHGEPTWSFLFRKMIPPLLAGGFRCIAVDYPGFGRSDKPLDLEWYEYERHAAACLRVAEVLELEAATLVGHDWGGPVGLLLAVERPRLFARFVLIDTPFFTGRQTMPPLWLQAHDYLLRTPDVAIADLVQAGCAGKLSAAARRGYEAPFSSPESKIGARAFPLRVLPRSPVLPAARACWRTMKAIRKDDRPTLTLWGEHDMLFPLELGEWVTGALRREPPIVIAGAGHFVPEERGEQAAAIVLDWLDRKG